ncbi:1-phosphofructokinase [Paenibacillus thalictri]|uniref:1-phosphofructokinase n=1 Tax=Paenibacillus thalictri TaxID=2527873 RepID=UPI001F0EEF8D|nr:1-phosphofructokinase [Paenibacillus thalictri]
MSIITTVTMNAAIDKTYYVPRFPLGKVTRVSGMIADAGGKGINVARVASLLGAQVTASGFAGGSNGRFIESELAKLGIAHDFVHVEGESRLCLNIMDEEAGTSTELLEPGPTVPQEQYEQLKMTVKQLAGRSRVLCFSGSMPAGVPVESYAELVAIARQAGATVLLDASGEALVRGITAAPFMIKPNEDEAAVLLGGPLDAGGSECRQQLARLAAAGIACVIVSLGADGAVALWDNRLYRIRVPRISAVNTVGSGDAFTAGFAVALAEGRAPEECLRLAAAAGSANALQRRAGWIDVSDVRSLAEQIAVEPMSV